jgi:hypothetical protein
MPVLLILAEYKGAILIAFAGESQGKGGEQ